MLSNIELFFFSKISISIELIFIMSDKSSFRAIPYFISQYLFFFIILLSFAFSNQSTSVHVADERYCSASNGKNWSNQYDPDYFYHLTDVHVTHYSKQTQDIFEHSLNIGVSYKSKSVLITGDLVDNYYLPYNLNDAQETKQMQEDWIEYHRVASKFSDKFDKIIESFGNHDIPRILSSDSHNFFYNKYSMIAESHHNFSLPNDTMYLQKKLAILLLLYLIQFFSLYHHFHLHIMCMHQHNT